MLLLCMDGLQGDPIAQAYYLKKLSTMSTQGNMTKLYMWTDVQMTS